jgi:hypothetical protein
MHYGVNVIINMVLSWILNALSKDFAPSVLYVDLAYEKSIFRKRTPLKKFQLVIVYMHSHRKITLPKLNN